MTNQEAIDKMEFCKRAYQKMIDENSQEGVFVGKGFEGKWKADTPLYKVYEDMRDACDMAIKALSTLDKVIAYCKKSPSAILPEDVLSLIRGEEVEIETDYGYEKFETCDKCEVGNPCLYCKHEFEPQERSDKECAKNI